MEKKCTFTVDQLVRLFLDARKDVDNGLGHEETLEKVSELIGPDYEDECDGTYEQAPLVETWAAEEFVEMFRKALYEFFTNHC